MPIMIGGGGGMSLPTLATPAGAGDILQGKQAVNASGELLTGTIPSKGNTTLSISAAGSTIAGGQYLAGNLVVPAEPNLVAANIRSGKSIFGVNGSFSGNVAQGSFTIATAGTTSYTLSGFGNFTPKYLVLTNYSIQSGSTYCVLCFYHSGDASGAGSWVGYLDENWEYGGGSANEIVCTFGEGSVTINTANLGTASGAGVFFAKGGYHYLVAG